MLLAGWTHEEAYDIAQRAYRLYSEGHLLEAAILFEGLTAIDPGDAYPRKALAAIAIRMGRPQLAIEHLSAVIEHDRFDAPALAARCEALIAAKDLTAARRDFASLCDLRGGEEFASRLRLLLLHQSAAASGAEAPQLPPGRLDNLYGW